MRRKTLRLYKPQNAKKQKRTPTNNSIAQQARVTGGQPVQGFASANTAKKKKRTKNNEMNFKKKI
jgi:hypothetical protein